MTDIFHLIENNSLRETEVGYQVQVRLNWYRSLPYSCIDTVALAIDGEQVDPDKIGFLIADRKYSMSELADLVEEYWFVQDPATVTVDQPGKIKAGESHEIEMSVAVRAPYIPTGPGQYLTMTTTGTAQQVAG